MKLRTRIVSVCWMVAVCYALWTVSLPASAQSQAQRYSRDNVSLVWDIPTPTPTATPDGLGCRDSVCE
jgi:hypothetical protein